MQIQPTFLKTALFLGISCLSSPVHTVDSFDFWFWSLRFSGINVGVHEERKGKKDGEKGKQKFYWHFRKGRALILHKSRRMYLLDFCRSQAVMTRAFAGRAKLTSQNQEHPLEICTEQIGFGWTWNLVSRSVSSLGLSDKIWEGMFGTECHLPLASSCLQKNITNSVKNITYLLMVVYVFDKYTVL